MSHRNEIKHQIKHHIFTRNQPVHAQHQRLNSAR